MTSAKPSINDLPRSIRSSGWNCISSGVRAVFHPKIAPSHRDCDLGFRCALRGREPVETKRSGA